MTAAFWILAFLTAAHVAPVLRVEHLQRRRSPGRRTEFRKAAGTAWIYIGFLGCWVPAVWRLYAGGDLTEGWTVAGLVLFAAGAALRAISLQALMGSYSAGVVLYEDHRLVRKGPYGVVRHPLHLGLVLETAGLVMVAPGSIGAVSWAVLLVYLTVRGRAEDRLLRKRFGEEAAAYQARTPAMIPWIRTGGG
jgi:protein-S-isoprenylcysteine O-methyltransferase Ste14